MVQFDKKSIAGRDIFIGTSAVGLLDLRATPLDSAVPGVEIHAQALEQMLVGRPPHAPGLRHRRGASVPRRHRRRGRLADLPPRRDRHRGHRRARHSRRLRRVWLAYRQAGLLFDPVYPVARDPRSLPRHLAQQLHRDGAGAEPRALGLQPLRGGAAGGGARAQPRQAEARRRNARGLSAVCATCAASPRYPKG